MGFGEEITHVELIEVIFTHLILIFDLTVHVPVFPEARSSLKQATPGLTSTTRGFTRYMRRVLRSNFLARRAPTCWSTGRDLYTDLLLVNTLLHD